MRRSDALLAVLVALVATATACARRERVTLEPEGTVTHTWVGESPPREPAPRAAPPAPAEGMPDADVVPEEKKAEAADPVPKTAEPPPPTRRGWTKGGSWDR
jgi:hypothetical protein